MEDITIPGDRPGQRVERQAKAHRRVAGDQVELLRPHEPPAALPARSARRRSRAAAAARSRRRSRAPARRRAPGARAPRVVELGVVRVDVDRELSLAPQVVPGVLVGGERELRLDAQLASERSRERGRVGGGVRSRPRLREEVRVVPDGQAVPAEVAGQRPARQRLARIPLALPVVEQAVRREAGVAGAASRSVAYRRLVGPSASMFHSAPRGRRRRRTSARRPSSAARHPRRARASTVRPERDDLAPRLPRCTAW